MMPLDINQLKQLSQRAKSGRLSNEDAQLLGALIQSYKELINLLKDRSTSQADLDQYLRSYKNETAADDAARDRSDSLPQAPDE
jgi:hypothetical protein